MPNISEHQVLSASVSLANLIHVLGGETQTVNPFQSVALSPEFLSTGLPGPAVSQEELDVVRQGIMKAVAANNIPQMLQVLEFAIPMVKGLAGFFTGGVA